MGFPDDADLGTEVELRLGTTWTDITPDTRLAQPITITRGRADYASTVDPSKVAVQIRNPDGRYSPRNPVGLYYGLLGRNTPLRASVAAGTPWLGLTASPAAGVRASAASATALNITGDLDVRFDVQPDDWNTSVGTIELGGKYGSSGQLSWRAYLFNGYVTFGWSTDGTTEVRLSAQVGTVPLPRRAVVRAVLDVNNGAGGHTIRFYIGTSMAGPWTQLGADQTSAGTSATFTSTAPVELGDVSSAGLNRVAGRMFGAQIRNGIDGTIIVGLDFATQQPGATTVLDASGRSWTVSSSAGITNRLVRGTGEVPSWPPRWGQSGRLVTVNVEASGIKRRLGTGASALDSTLRRRIPSDPDLIAYWPMEEPGGATQAYSPLPRVRPMTVNGLTFGSDDSLPGSNALPVFGSPSSTSAIVPYDNSGTWRVEFVYKTTAAPAGDANQQFLVITTNTAVWRFGVGATDFHLDVTTPDGGSLYTTDYAMVDFFQIWSRFVVQAKQSGSNVTFEVFWIAIGGVGRIITDVFAGTVGHVTSVGGARGPALSGMVMGHLGVFGVYDTSIYNDADKGFSGESAAARFSRLVSEERIPSHLPYGSFGTEAMGAQRSDTALNLLQDAANADEGAILYEPRDSIAIALRPRVSLYNQAVRLTLDYDQAQVGVPLEPEDDDQATRNDITVTRTAGSSARATLDAGPLSTLDPPDGVGRYTDTVEENLATDDQPVQHAAWRLHMGTYDGVRYPAVTISLHRCPELIDAARELDIGDRIQILNPPPWLPPGTIDLIVQGITEVIGVRTWTMTLNCSPGGPWVVGVIGDAVLGRIRSGSSTLTSGISSTATTAQVTVAAGSALWTTDPTKWPFDVRVSGEVWRVTAVSGSSSPQTFTMTRSINGVVKAQTAGLPIDLDQPMVIPL